jgi:hypothetical protein
MSVARTERKFGKTETPNSKENWKMYGMVTIGFTGGKATVLCNKCGKPVEEKGKEFCKDCEKEQKPMSVEEKLKAFRSGRIGTMGW